MGLIFLYTEDEDNIPRGYRLCPEHMFTTCRFCNTRFPYRNMTDACMNCFPYKIPSEDEKYIHTPSGGKWYYKQRGKEMTKELFAKETLTELISNPPGVKASIGNVVDGAGPDDPLELFDIGDSTGSLKYMVFKDKDDIYYKCNFVERYDDEYFTPFFNSNVYNGDVICYIVTLEVDVKMLWEKV